MVKAARKYERIVQCGSQQRSMKECRIGCELVRNGKIGKIHTIHTSIFPSPWDQPFPAQPVPDGLDWNTWLGPTPERAYHTDLFTPRAKPGWISIVTYSGGEATGWGAHGLDLIQWAMGMDASGPVEIWTEGGNPLELDRPVFMRYANGAVLKCDGKGPQGGAVFEGENGTITVDRGRFETKPDKLTEEDLADAEDKLEVSQNHQQNWLDCIRSRKLPIADVEVGHRSTTVCHLVNIARWTHRKLNWDPEKEIFTGDKDATTYIDRPRRSPWELPEI